MSKIEYSVYTHIGNVRENNEDNFYCPGVVIEMRQESFSTSGKAEFPCVFAVCDGMGGQDFGELASFEATNVLSELDAAVKIEPSDKINEMVQYYVEKANNIICERVREKSTRLGTTLALVVVADNEVRPFNLGDSRIYELTGGKLNQITEDHTLAEQKVKMGFLTREQAKTDKGRHKLSRFLGMFEEEMTMVAEPLPALPLINNRILLCSDGLTEMVEDEKIEEILTNAPIEQAAEMLVSEALAGGGIDNVTCIVLEYAHSKRHSSKLVVALASFIAIAIIVLVVALIFRSVGAPYYYRADVGNLFSMFLWK